MIWLLVSRILILDNLISSPNQSTSRSIESNKSTTSTTSTRWSRDNEESREMMPLMKKRCRSREMQDGRWGELRSYWNERSSAVRQDIILTWSAEVCRATDSRVDVSTGAVFAESCLGRTSHCFLRSCTICKDKLDDIKMDDDGLTKETKERSGWV